MKRKLPEPHGEQWQPGGGEAMSSLMATHRRPGSMGVNDESRTSGRTLYWLLVTSCGWSWGTAVPGCRQWTAQSTTGRWSRGNQAKPRDPGTLNDVRATFECEGKENSFRVVNRKLWLLWLRCFAPMCFVKVTGIMATAIFKPIKGKGEGEIAEIASLAYC